MCVMAKHFKTKPKKLATKCPQGRKRKTSKGNF